MNTPNVIHIRAPEGLVHEKECEACAKVCEEFDFNERKE